MNEFKEAHKQYQKSLKENSQLRELRGDIDIIEMEKENGEYKNLFVFFSSSSSSSIHCNFFSINYSIHHHLKLKINRLPWLDLYLIWLTCDFQRMEQRIGIPEHFFCWIFFFSLFSSEEKDRPHAVTLRQAVESGITFGSRSCIANRERTAKGAQNAAWTPNGRYSKSINGKRKMNNFFSLKFSYLCLSLFFDENVQKSNTLKFKWLLDSYEAAKWNENCPHQFIGTITTADNEFVGRKNTGQFLYSRFWID